MSRSHAEGSDQPPESPISTFDKEEHRVDMAKHPEEDDDLEKGMKIESRLHSEKDEEIGQKPLDPNLVDWDGPEDPANPMNWPKSKRMGHVTLISLITLVVNLAATMYAPGAGDMMKDFHQTNSTIASLSVTLFLLGFAVGPMLIAPLSELYGRLPLYHACNAIFIIFCIAAAVSTDIGMFLAFRFLAGCGGSAPLTLGGGTIADVIPQEKRGGAMALYAMGPLIGPVIGPVAGGFAAQSIGWRWTFWILAIAGGSLALACLIFMRETYGNVLLKHKAARLRKETGNLHLISKGDLGLSPRALFLHSIVRPLKLLLFSPIVLLLSLFAAVVFGQTFLLFTTFPTVFEEQYGFTTGTSGLSYLGMGIGMILGIITFRLLSDKILTKAALDGDGTMKPEYRLPLMVYLTPVMPIGFFWYGWSAYAQVHWIVPIIGTGFIGIGSLFVIMPIQIYLVDAFGEYAASALAANTMLRSLAGTFLPLAGPPMYKALGLGWGNSLLGFLSLGFAVVPIFFWKYGEQVRTRWVVKL
ncbi:MFS transporter prlG [Lachnellula cervina]|uniref:MFS transporter prlG n=1 Tax=Lachnellula cervina TaxID=1316786 RepID=A0A7D8ZD76_9HELO|nr:MFS transporter prlG [Lachnellula cervina]